MSMKGNVSEKKELKRKETLPYHQLEDISPLTVGNWKFN